MRFRVRGPNGATTISLDNSATFDELRHSISNATKLSSFGLLYGYPPQPLDLDQFAGEVRLADSGFELEGEQLIVKATDIDISVQGTARELQSSITNVTSLSPTSEDGSAYSHVDRPLNRQDRATSRPLILSRKENDGSGDPPEIPVPSHNGTLVLRVMPDDNSCMFRALSSAVLGSALDGVTELRSLVASSIQTQPDIYTQAILEKPPKAYCAWIQRDDAWGGAIELGILAQQFDIEVCSINVQDLRVDRFNEGRPTRCFIVYSGIHYDVLALSPSEPPHTRADLPDDFDVKVFDSADDILVLKATELCKVLQSRHYYTDTAGFAIRCNQCLWQGKGELAANEHAKKSGHIDFGEA